MKIFSVLKNKWLYLALAFLSVVNLFYMHRFVLETGTIEVYSHTKFFFLDNFMSILFDVSVLILCFYVLTIKRMKLTLIIVFVLTWLWSFANVIYARFFFQYLTLNMVSNASNLLDSFFLDYVPLAFGISDIVLLSTMMGCVFLSCKLRSESVNVKQTYFVLGFPIVLVLVYFSAHFIRYTFVPATHLRGSYCEYIESENDCSDYNLSPNKWNFSLGFFRCQVRLFFEWTGAVELSSEDLVQIKTFVERPNEYLQKCTVDRKNLIFILVESYWSSSSGLSLTNGQEVTPFLNSLKNDTTVYFNAKVKPNIGRCMSFDGQFIYMSGLLPMQSESTLSYLNGVELCGLGTLMKLYANKETRMVIPTAPSVWNQADMCCKYGIDRLNSSIDYNSSIYIGDEKLFKFAKQEDEKAKSPFFSVVLTLTMHSPYEVGAPKDYDFSFPAGYSSGYCNYLKRCKYLDEQIESYFKHLKESGLYDESVIVIASDHLPLYEWTGDEKAFPEYMPLYIVNSGLDLSKAYDGEINQVDVYPTILDMFGIESEWRGIGKSIFSDDYSNVVNDSAYIVSEKIIRGRYFNKD